MGLFSFLKDAGAKIFGKKDKKVTPRIPTGPSNSEKEREIEIQHRLILLQGTIDNLGLEGYDISVELEGTDVVILKGTADTQAIKEKLILTLGNIEGVAFVDDRVEVTNPEPPAVFYTVAKGDSLSKIAKKYYSNAKKYPQIFEANKPMLTDVDKIYPGQVLRIPPLEGTYSATVQTYTVQSGDSLSKIAKEVYGDARKYQMIFEANQPMLKSPEQIKVGQILNIPPATIA